MIPTEAYPLSWPAGWPRTPSHERQPARWRKQTTHRQEWRDGTGAMRVSETKRSKEVSTADALARLRSELERMGVDGVIVSTNVQVRQDGLPYSNRREPEDPGVAVYFILDRQPYCLPCDRWARVADNIAAVAAHVDAMRGMERWGVGSTAQQFAGFKALPPAGGTSVSEVGAPWWQVLGARPDDSFEQVRTCYRALASKHHPDRGGDAGAMAAINRAWEQAQGALGGPS